MRRTLARDSLFRHCSTWKIILVFERGTKLERTIPSTDERHAQSTRINTAYCADVVHMSSRWMLREWIDMGRGSWGWWNTRGDWRALMFTTDDRHSSDTPRKPGFTMGSLRWRATGSGHDAEPVVVSLDRKNVHPPLLSIVKLLIVEQQQQQQQQQQRPPLSRKKTRLVFVSPFP